MSGPPLTDNAEARALIGTAQARCPSCRVTWRLKVGTFLHRLPGSRDTVRCLAPEQRQALREIASRGKDAAILERVRKPDADNPLLVACQHMPWRDT